MIFDWPEHVDPSDLNYLHHACRMMTTYPGISARESAYYTELADRLWAEIGKRSLALSPDSYNLETGKEGD